MHDSFHFIDRINVVFFRDRPLPVFVDLHCRALAESVSQLCGAFPAMLAAARVMASLSSEAAFCKLSICIIILSLRVGGAQVSPGQFL